MKYLNYQGDVNEEAFAPLFNRNAFPEDIALAVADIL